LEGLAHVPQVRQVAIMVTMARMKSAGLFMAVMISLRVMVKVLAPMARPFISRKRSLPVLGMRDSMSYDFQGRFSISEVDFGANAA
jgi:hypothetical protein